MHLFIRVIGNRVSHYHDLIAKLSGITNSGLHTSVRDESHDDELMDAVLLELQIQICVGETTGTPVLLNHNLTGSRMELAADLATHVPFSKVFRNHAAFWMGAMYFQVS